MDVNLCARDVELGSAIGRSDLVREWQSQQIRSSSTELAQGGTYVESDLFSADEVLAVGKRLGDGESDLGQTWFDVKI